MAYSAELINENLKSIEQYVANVIEFHAVANNHVFQQFYSPHFSKRKDNWLVYTEKRIKLPLQVIDLWSKFIEQYDRPNFIFCYWLFIWEAFELAIILYKIV